jgi:hypothetical protein
MKSFFQSFYGKLSAIFLILLLLMAVIQIFITIDASRSFYSQTDQALNQNLAKDIAKEFTPAVQDSLDMAAIEHMMHYMMVMNPKIEIYLLDNKGKILAFFAEPQKKVKAQYVDLEPVKDFINGSEEIPILGDDPRHPGRRKVFSAAPIQISGKPGFRRADPN